ncbi:MAG: gliding motility lipoprotein GldH [Salinivirgaceae bacterium]|nr:MAG: gliding motility lipoprotein GldH [Salinivirgaceae bacterium]
MKTVISLTFILVVIFSGCDKSRVFDEYAAMPEENWNMDSIKYFPFQIEDSLAIYNMYINIRNTGKYEFSNLIVFVETDLPGQLKLRDTVNCILADEKGEWLGSGFGSIWTSKIPYKIKFRFPRNGQYDVHIQHGMRKEDLTGISDIGIRIEKAF